MPNSRLVYSTDDGDRRRKPVDAAAPQEPRNDGIVRVSREKGSRGGKTVTIVRGLPAAHVATVARQLKRHCGSGGTAKDATVEIQGDHREKVAEWLEANGHRVKRAGG